MSLPPPRGPHTTPCTRRRPGVPPAVGEASRGASSICASASGSSGVPGSGVQPLSAAIFCRHSCSRSALRAASRFDCVQYSAASRFQSVLNPALNAVTLHRRHRVGQPRPPGFAGQRRRYQQMPRAGATVIVPRHPQGQYPGRNRFSGAVVRPGRAPRGLHTTVTRMFPRLGGLLIVEYLRLLSNGSTRASPDQVASSSIAPSGTRSRGCPGPACVSGSAPKRESGVSPLSEGHRSVLRRSHSCSLAFGEQTPFAGRVLRFDCTSSTPAASRAWPVRPEPRHIVNA